MDLQRSIDCRVAVLMGGDSSEREISLQSGEAVLSALTGLGIEAYGLDTRDAIGDLFLGPRPDLAFIALHGRGGEDGAIQGLLDTLKIPYTGSGILGSALSMDKLTSKRIWKGMALPTPEFLKVASEEDAMAAVSLLGLPLMVKPANEGSSIGLSRVDDPSDMREAWVKARHCDREVIAEAWIDGPEYTVAIIGDRILPEVQIETTRDFYDYEAKYVANDTRFTSPSPMHQKEREAMHRLAMDAFLGLRCHGWGRVDLKVDGSGQPWLIEVNSIPGMTDHSLVPLAAKAAGISFDELVAMILATSGEGLTDG